MQLGGLFTPCVLESQSDAFFMGIYVQDDLGFKAEYVHPYVDGVDDPRNRTFRASCFNSRKLSAVFTGGPGVEEVPSVWVDRAGFKANLTEVSVDSICKFVSFRIVSTATEVATAACQ